MTVPVQIPTIQYIASGTTSGPFAYPFKISDQGDLQVYLNGVLQTSGYVVTGVGVESGGDVTFGAILTAGTKVLLKRFVSIERTKFDYQTNGDLLADTLNADIDRIWMALQDVGYYLGSGDASTARALLLGDGDVSGAGAYLALQNKIQDLADPVASQDAVNLRTMQAAIADLVATGGGDIVIALLSNNVDPTLGAALVGFIAPDGSAHKVSDLANPNAVGNGDALIAVKQPFTGAGARTQHDKNAELVMLTDMAGVKMNDSSAATRAANSAALVSLLTQRKGVKLPEGVLWVSSGTPLTSFWNIEGAGAEATIIKGDGDLFSITSATNGEMRRFANLKIMNDVTSGKLISYVNATPNNRVQFENVNFDKATYHVYCAGGGESVSWSFHFCRFINASVESRHFEGLWVYREAACYTWNNRIGLRCTNGAVTSCSIDGGVYEQHDDSAIVLEASNVSFEIAAFRINAHFEANGKVTNRADVAISTSVATRVQAVVFSACGFYSPIPTQTNRISLTAAGGGGIDNIIVDGCAVTGTVPLTQNASAIKERNVYRQTGNPQNAATVPQLVAYQYSQNYLGSVRVIGAAVGSGGVVASITPPAGTFLTRATVDGNIYNGVANTNTAQLIGTYSGTNGSVHAQYDVNHSAGTNQGFVISAPGGVVTISNKGGMSASQSGDVLFEFFR